MDALLVVSLDFDCAGNWVNILGVITRDCNVWMLPEPGLFSSEEVGIEFNSDGDKCNLSFKSFSTSLIEECFKGSVNSVFICLSICSKVFSGLDINLFNNALDDSLVFTFSFGAFFFWDSSFLPALANNASTLRAVKGCSLELDW